MRAGARGGPAGALALAAMAAGCGGSARVGTGTVSPVDSLIVYDVLVANEASDAVSLVRFQPGRNAQVASEIPMSEHAGEIEGLSGLAVAPDRSRWYASLSRGDPNGRIWKMSEDTLIGAAEVGGSPGAMDITPDGRLLFVANRNLDGPPVASSISIVHTATMTEVARSTTCIQPEGSRLDASAARLYTTCRRSDQLVEIDAHSYRVLRRLSLEPGREKALASDASGTRLAHGLLDGSNLCLPSWVETGRGVAANRFVYVTCAGSGGVDIVDTHTWSVVGRVALGGAPVMVAGTPDGSRLVVTLRDAQAVAVVDLRAGREIGRVRTSVPLPHGVAVSPDGRYAFVTGEATGVDPGTVDVIDLRTPERVASTKVRFQPGPIVFWRMSGG